MRYKAENLINTNDNRPGDLQLKFVLEYGIDYLLVSAAYQLSDQFNDHFILAFADPQSGTRLYIRKDNDISYLYF